MSILFFIIVIIMMTLLWIMIGCQKKQKEEFINFRSFARTIKQQWNIITPITTWIKRKFRDIF